MGTRTSTTLSPLSNRQVSRSLQCRPLMSRLQNTYSVVPMAAGDVAQYTEFTNLKQSNPDLKTFISIGGWSFNDPPTQTVFSDLAASETNRRAFANSLVKCAFGLQLLAGHFSRLVTAGSWSHTALTAQTCTYRVLLCRATMSDNARSDWEYPGMLFAFHRGEAVTDDLVSCV